MNKIIEHGIIDVPQGIIDIADKIKFENYKVNTPSKFHIRDDIDTMFKFHLSAHLGREYDSLNFVYFSVCKGAEPHIDLLDPEKFEPRTFVIPIILPTGKSVITAEEESIGVELNHIYEFNHERIHSMELEDMESGCVVIMVAVKRI